MKIRVIGIGDNVCDKYYPAKIMYPGGQALNFSVYTKMLGADSAYMGVFGRDAEAEHVIRTLDKLCVEHSRCRSYDGENGYAKVRLVGGDREFIMSNHGGIVNEHPLVLDEKDLSYIKTFQLVHTSNNGHFDKELSKVRKIGVPISYDFSGRWEEDYFLDVVAPWVDYAFISCGKTPEKEVQDVCRAYLARGCRLVIATRGRQGSMVYDGKQFYVQVPELVEAIDTLGAGDSFAAAFLLSMMEKGDMSTAMSAGAGFAAKTCMVNGAFGYGTPFEDV